MNHEGPPREWAGAFSDAEHHHQQPAGTTHADQPQDNAAPAVTP